MIISAGSAADNILFNGTIYLAASESAGLEQGYTLGIKGVSSDGSVWIQLTDDDTILKNEIVHDYGHLIYSRDNRTILSVKVDKIYSGTLGQHLVALTVHQFIDSDKPVPDNTERMPADTQRPINNTSHASINTQDESILWILTLVLFLILIYILRRLW